MLSLRRSLLTATALWVLASSDSLGQQPNTRSLAFKRPTQQTNASFDLTEQHGPWMILVASFAGDHAEHEAVQLIQEIRQRFRMPAYLHRKRYDFTEPVQGLGLDRYGQPKKMRHQTAVVLDEIAVLAGDFPSVNDPQLEKALQMIKYAQPNCLSGQNAEKTTLQFASVRSQLKNLSKNEQKRRKGPLGSAFVTRNPLLPREYFVPAGFDKLVEQMNANVPYSLLDCPGKYTVRVATFRGNVVIDQRKVRQIEETGQMVSKLAEAGEKAHALTQALRQRGIEAYEFHDRHESIVTIGSFNSVGAPLDDGRIEINPAIHKIVTTYGAQQQAIPGQQFAGLMPRTMNGISFDVQPTPVEVPRRSFASDYAR